MFPSDPAASAGLAVTCLGISFFFSSRELDLFADTRVQRKQRLVAWLGGHRSWDCSMRGAFELSQTGRELSPKKKQLGDVYSAIGKQSQRGYEGVHMGMTQRTGGGRLGLRACPDTALKSDGNGLRS